MMDVCKDRFCPNGNPQVDVVVVLLGFAGLLVSVSVLYIWIVRWFGIQQPYYKHYDDFVNQQMPMKNLSKSRITKKIAENMPPPYPNGWFSLCFSDELAIGQIKYIHALGQHIALFRGESGTVHAIEAYCSHLGANLAIGGTIQGDCIQCPFHHWKFDGKGNCTHIPNTVSIPSNAKIRSYLVKEVDFLILLWHSKDEAAKPFPPPRVPEIAQLSTSRELFNSYCTGRSEHVVACHIQELPENGADNSHLDALHASFIVPLLRPFMRHKWDSKWCGGSEKINAESVDNNDNKIKYEWYKSFVTINEQIYLFNIHLKPFDVTVTGNQWGPGVVILRYVTPFGTIILVETVLPQRPMQLQVRHAVFATWAVPSIMASLFLRAAIVQFERDIPIWSSKIFKSNPVLVTQDAAIPRYRRWFSQFYSNDSETFVDALIKDQAQVVEW